MRIHVLGMGASIVIGPPGQFTAGRVLFASGPTTIGQSANFFWDDAANGVGELVLGSSVRSGSSRVMLEIFKDANIGIADFAQITISGTTNRNLGMAIGYDTTNNRGYLSARETTVLGHYIRIGNIVDIGSTAQNDIVPVTTNTVALGTSALRFNRVNSARYDSGASTGFSGTVAPPLTITVVGGIVTNVA